MLALRRFAIEARSRKLESSLSVCMTQKAGRLAHIEGVLRVLSPDATLARGYSITSDSGGAIIRGKGAVQAGDRIRTRFADGSINSEVL